ncbi:CDP-glucose 4,6-dehydratase [bacterium]|nr:CDP-glucose 4,6-dehydratase [bacterium]
MSLTGWRNRRVLVTGHTGFKGSWLSLWLHRLGARVYGYALDPATQPSLFQVADVASVLAADVRRDVALLAGLQESLHEAQAEVVFHLAAQPLVRESYRDPIQTLATNVMGTAHLLEAVREQECVRAVVVVTTDKVYENREWLFPYREVDPLGGRDPYSASKAATELVVATYRSSFLDPRRICVATARAGNVVGGGDWSPDRLVPDCLRAFEAGQPVRLRYPQAERPWQHVLEPLAGYLALGERLLGAQGREYAGAWNFGPEARDNATVGTVAAQLAQLWGSGMVMDCAEPAEYHEAGLLRLDISQASHRLNWSPRWSLHEALQATVDWQRAYLRGENMGHFCGQQIDEYQRLRE